MLFKSVVAAIILGGVSPGLQGQVFRSGAELRVLDVVVTDNDGRPVNGLGVNDFEVMEDGERRIVKYVTPIAVPEVSPVIDRRPAPSSSDVWTNESTASQRVFAIVIDDLSTRASDTAKARSIVRRFIERLPDGDLVSVVFTGQQTGAQEFTSDKARLRRTVDQFVGRNAIPDLDSVTSDDPTSMAVLQRGTALTETRANVERILQTVINVTDWLSSVEDRRKAILFVTAALPVALTQAILAGADSPDLSGGAGTSALFARLLTRASLANIAVYPLDYQGLSTPLNRELTRSSFGGTSPLAVLADQTGGVAAIHTNDVDRLFDTMIRDSSAYYLVGYEPTVERDEKRARHHRIEVRSRVTGTTVRTRHSYVTAPTRRGPRESTAADLLSSPLPGGSLGLRVQATAFPSARNQGRVMVVLEVSGQDMAVVPDRVQQTVALIYRLVATDVHGKVRAAQAKTVTLRLSEDRLHQIADAGVRVIGQLDLPPGSYRLRASVVNQGSHGVAAGDVDVPDYKKRRIGVTGVLLASRESAKAPVRREDYAPFKGRLPAVPTTQRAFALQEQIEAYLEVDAGDQRPQAGPATEVPTVTATIETKSGQMVEAIPVTVGALERGIGGGQVYPVHTTVKTAGFRAGDYVLSFSASIESAPMLSQMVAFSLR